MLKVPLSLLPLLFFITSFSYAGVSPFPGTELKDNVKLPAHKVDQKASVKLVIQFMKPLFIHTSQMTGSSDYEPEELSGYLNFQDGQWVPQKRVNKNRTFCELAVFPTKIQRQRNNDDGEMLYSDLSIAENVVISEVDYYVDDRSSKGQYDLGIMANFRSHRWTLINQNGTTVPAFLGSKNGDKVSGFLVIKNYHGSKAPQQTDLEINVSDIKSCFGSQSIRIMTVPVNYIVP